MLEELSKFDSDWRKIALKICGCKQLADDLVNDMYLKMHELKPKSFNRHYISYSIYHQFLNYKKQNEKTISIEQYHFKNYTDNTLEIRKRVNEILDELGIIDREILLHTHEKSLRDTSKELFMSHTKLHYKKQIALEKLLNTNGVKLWKHERR